MKIEEAKSLVSEACQSLDYLLDDLNQNNVLPTGYVVRMKQVLSTLDNVYESLVFYDKHPLYQLMHDALHEARKRDKQIKSFVVKVNLDPNPGVPALFEFNFFPPQPADYTPNNFS